MYGRLDRAGNHAPKFQTDNNTTDNNGITSAIGDTDMYPEDDENYLSIVENNGSSIISD
jgi:hypothetical protein